MKEIEQAYWQISMEVRSQVYWQVQEQVHRQVRWLANEQILEQVYKQIQETYQHEGDNTV